MTITMTENYRFVQIRTNICAEFYEFPYIPYEEPKWTGSLEMLNLEYPPKNFGSDPLGTWENRSVRISHRFERQAEDGSWCIIDDPRYPISTLLRHDELQCLPGCENFAQGSVCLLCQKWHVVLNEIRCSCCNIVLKSDSSPMRDTCNDCDKKWLCRYKSYYGWYVRFWDRVTSQQ